MAITNAQQYRQLRRQGGIMGSNGGSMLVTPTRDGSRPGYYGPDAGHENDPGHGSNAPGGDGNNNNKKGRDLDFQQRGMSKKDYAQTVADKEQAERDKLKKELLVTPVGRNKPLSKLGLYNANFQRNMNIKLAQKRALQKYKDIEQYTDLMDEYGLTAEEIADKVANDPSYGYDFGELEKGLETLTSNRNTSIESTRPNLYDVNPTLQGRFSLFNPVVDKIRPDTQVTALNTLNKARDYTDLVNTADTMTNQDIRDTMTGLANRGKTEDQINPRDGGGDEIFLPITPYQQDVVAQEPEEELSELQGLLANRMAYRFMADGGRAAYQDGSPAVDPRMARSLQENVAANEAQRASNQSFKDMVVQGAQQNLQRHFANNELLRDAVSRGELSSQDYNKLGGYDYTQNVTGGEKITGGLTNLLGSPVYNLIQAFKGEQDFSPILGTALRNAQGGFGMISDDLKSQYENIVNQQPSAMPQGSPGQLNPTPTQDDYYAQNESAIRSGMMPAQRPTMADVAGAAKTNPRAGIQEAFLNELLTTGPNQGQLFTSVAPDFDRYGTYTGDDQLLKDYAAAGRGTPTSQLVKLPANHPYAVTGPGYYEYNGTDFSKIADLNMTPEYEKMIRLNYGLASGGRVGYAYGSGLKLAQLLQKAGKSLKQAIKEAVDNINPTGDKKLDADMAIDDMLETYSIDRDAVDGYDILNAYDEAYKTIANPKTMSEVETLEAMGANITAKTLELVEKYPGLNSELARKIASDPDPQRQAEVISTIEQAFELMKQGKSSDEVLDIMNQMTDRTKQAGGGLSYLSGF